MYPQICVYADDTLIILGSNSADTLETVVSNCTENVETLLSNVCLQLNVSKTEILLLTNLPRRLRLTSRPIVFKIKNLVIPSKDQIKYLGIILDDKLTFYPHVKYIEEKCMRRLPKLSPLM